MHVSNYVFLDYSYILCSADKELLKVKTNNLLTAVSISNNCNDFIILWNKYRSRQESIMRVSAVKGTALTLIMRSWSRSFPKGLEYY